MEIELKFFRNILFTTYIKYIDQKLNYRKKPTQPMSDIVLSGTLLTDCISRVLLLLDGRIGELGVTNVEPEMKPIILRLVETTA